MPQDKIELIADIAKVAGVHVTAVVITLSNVEGTLKIVSLAIAISYGIWKFRTDYLKHRDGKNK